MPGLHGVSLVARSRQYVPAAHTSHVVLPLLDWCVPTAHGVQMLCRALAVIVPASHGVALNAPAWQAEPAGHSLHSDGALAPIVLRYVPASHSRCALAPSSQYEPRGQSMHSVDRSADW